MSKNKALIIILSVITLIIVGLLAFYFYFLKPSVGPEEQTDSNGNSISFPLQGSGTNKEDVVLGENASEEEGSGNSPREEEALRQITQVPVAGATLLTRGKDTFIHYIEKATGHIYELKTTDTRPQRISNTTIAKIHEALWTDRGEGVLTRFLKDDTETIQTFYAKLVTIGSTTERELQGSYLDNDIKEVAVAPNQDKIFTLYGSEGVVGTISNLDGTKKTQIFNSPFVEWTSSWPNETTITLTTKSSYLVPGLLYFLNTKTGNLQKIIGNVFGLTTRTSPDLSKVLYSESAQGTFKTHIKNIKTNSDVLVDLQALPEKCVWGTKDTNVVYCAVPQGGSTGNFPDQWYQGLSSFNDTLWAFDSESGTANLVINPTPQNIDIYQPTIDQSGNNIIFINKKDSSLWLLDLTRVK